MCVPQVQVTLASRELRGTDTKVTCRLEHKYYGRSISSSEDEVTPLELRRRTKTGEMIEAAKRVLKDGARTLVFIIDIDAVKEGNYDKAKKEIETIAKIVKATKGADFGIP